MKPRLHPTPEDASDDCERCGALCDGTTLCRSCWEDDMASIREDEAMDDLLMEVRGG